MIHLDEDALICDFAETYHIYDYTALPPFTAGALAYGLRDDSRIKMKMSGHPISMDQALRAFIADKLAVLVWQGTKDGMDGVDFPDSILSKLLGREKETNNRAFDNGADFDAYRENLINGWN